MKATETAIEAAYRVLKDQQSRLETIRSIVGDVVKPVEPKDIATNQSILLNNIDREMSLFARATAQSSGQNAMYERMKPMLQGFIHQHGAELFPDAAYHMSGPVSIIKDNVVEAYTRKLAARYRPEQGSDTYNLRILYSQIADEFRAEIARLAEQGKVMCPYIAITTAGVVIDPESFEPVVGFLTRYGVQDAPK